MGLREDEAGAPAGRRGVVEHEGEAGLRVRRVEGDVGAAGLEDAVEGDEQLDGIAPCRRPTRISGPTPRPRRRAARRLARRVELAVGEVVALEGEGDGVGGPAARAAKRAWRVAGLGVVEGGVVPGDEELVALGVREEGEGVEGLVGGAGEALDDLDEVAEHALDRGGVEAGGVEAEAEEEGLAGGRPGG